MELKYTLTENDYLQQQLYLASKSKLIKKQRIKSRLLVLIILLVIGFLFYMAQNIFLTYYFGGSGVICFFLYPIYLKFYYQRHYRKYIKENFKNRIGIISTLLFKEDVLEAYSENIGSSEVKFSAFENISEIKDYFFIALKTGVSIMIPKSEIINIEAVRSELKMITEKIGINFISELNWKWK
ncbi:YcxB family protein [Flavobacterium johnsoniae]|uniref:YcxB-like C-terminal domain-containing protein n=1 Tax=Flavobacterium johnsoniae TaxID=986 RepID=A0A1M5GZ04_FLAJO|nr:YcxB family protein [Flavobacterium johnsoniae]SHG08855.1 hypothetical protein SAMN05444388_101623 [Flavobacterium johnsoniae]